MISDQTVEIAILTTVIGLWVMLLVVWPVCYWLGKRSVRVESLDRQPSVGYAQGRDYLTCHWCGRAYRDDPTDGKAPKIQGEETDGTNQRV